MLNILNRAKSEAAVAAHPLGDFLDGFSIEVMPRTAAKVADFKALLPAAHKRGLVLVDPSYELSGDDRATVAGVREAVKRFNTGCFVVWYPMLQRRR